MPDISYSWLLWRLGTRSSHFPLLSLFEHRAERGAAHKRLCERVGAEVQPNSEHFGTGKETSCSPIGQASSLYNFLGP